MEIRKFMVPLDKLVTCNPTDNVRLAIKRMADANVGSVIIMENSDARGIVTTHDILIQLSEKEEAAFDVLLNEIMSDELITVKASGQLNNAINKMEEIKTHHLVVKDKGKVVGVISSFDLIKEKALDNKAHPWIRS